MMLLISVAIIKNQQEAKLKMGKDGGSIQTFYEIHSAIGNEFGTIESKSENKTLYTKKADAIVVIKEDGVKTIRAESNV